jgi:hypothetical protein
MKILITLIGLCSFFICKAQQQHELVKLWETDSILAIPESVLPDADEKVLYVSLIDGEPWGSDGKGGIAKLNPDGKILNSRWVEGLNAPKGMGLFKDKLYIADITKVVVVNIKTGKIEQKLPILGSEGLNDVTIDLNGIVYVSDSRTGQIFKINNGKSAVYLDSIKGVNGLKSIGSDLFILASPYFYKVGSNKKLVQIADGLEQGADGIEPIGNGGFIVSCWGGIIYSVSADGKKQILLDSQQQKMNTADIGFIPGKNIVYVPTFFKKTVAAYQLK